ncbi:hypothetical protein MHBO_001167 [Bonamia ostreae]|uniref:Uncharacterized protein n=1 Tax=Bonamia ostreae TaxID=126728 RepID=A0ABV2AIV9_9EUKA
MIAKLFYEKFVEGDRSFDETKRNDNKIRKKFSKNKIELTSDEHKSISPAKKLDQNPDIVLKQKYEIKKTSKERNINYKTPKTKDIENQDRTDRHLKIAAKSNLPFSKKQIPKNKNKNSKNYNPQKNKFKINDHLNSGASTHENNYFSQKAEKSRKSDFFGIAQNKPKKAISWIRSKTRSRSWLKDTISKTNSYSYYDTDSREYSYSYYDSSEKK